MIMMSTRNDIKDKLVQKQFPFSTKDKVLSYTIPIDHDETVLFRGNSNDGTSATRGSTHNVRGGGTLNCTTPDDDPCNGRESLALFLDEGLGTSLDGADDISSPIFSVLGRNESGVFSSDEGAGGVGSTSGASTILSRDGVHGSHTSVIPASTNSCKPNCDNKITIAYAPNNNTISTGEVISWTYCTTSNAICTNTISPATTTSIRRGESGTATISLLTDSALGKCASSIPPPPIKTSSKIKSNNSGNRGGDKIGSSPQGTQEPQSEPKEINSENGDLQPSALQQQRSKSMPLGRQGPQKCSICDKVFSNASALTKHKLTHSDERRHACATCGKAFKRQDHLNGHMLTHRNKKPFECKSKGCGKSYCDARSLRRHVENRHGLDALESMNLSNPKQGSKNNHHSPKTNSSTSCHQISSGINSEPQPELMQFTPEKSDSVEGSNSCHADNFKTKDCMPVLQREPQPQLEIPSHEAILEKVNIPTEPFISFPVIAQGSRNKGRETSNTTSIPPAHLLNAPPPALADGLPVLLKQEISTNDFNETIDAVARSVMCSRPNTSALSSRQEKFLSPTIKVGGTVDTVGMSGLPDVKLFQEWTKRLGDSKVALFLASSPSTGLSSITQLANPTATTSFKLDGHAGTGTNHTIVSSENNLFSVTPISIVPTSSGEFTLKPANLPTSAEEPKQLYILPSAPLSTTSALSPLSLHPQSSVLLDPVQNKKTSKDPKRKGEQKESRKSGKIAASLASRIKTKLKAGSVKEVGKMSSTASASKSVIPQSQRQSPVASSRKHCAGDVNHSATSKSGGTVIAAGEVFNPGELITWSFDKDCPKDVLANGVEDDRLSEGGGPDGEDKPVECSICCRRFKNTPALNGHMRLHGGYFKKETEGNKKKEVSREHTQATPLQTASVSVRALIEEKIKERRNNLLKLAAASVAEKESESPTTTLSSNQPTHPAVTSRNSSISDPPKVKGKDFNQSPANDIAQEQPRKLFLGKLKIDPATLSSSEKDSYCDRLHVNASISNTTNDIIRADSISLTINSDNAALESIDPNFHNLIPTIIGQNMKVVGIGGESGGVPPSSNQIQTPLPREATILQPASRVNSLFPIQVNKSNVALVECGNNPKDLCQTLHFICLDSGGNDGVTDLPLMSTFDQDPLGKVSKILQESLPDMSTRLPDRLLTEGHRSSLKEIMEPIMSCPPPPLTTTLEDPCHLPWDWRNSTSSDNTDNSFSNVQDCVGSLLCSSSSDVLDESCTKDPVAGGGGYCFTPILSPNSSFCLTPAPDSPFEAAQPSQSLSFICPSPSIGNGPMYNMDPGVYSLVNPPSSVEPVFSPEQPQPLSVNSVHTSSTESLRNHHPLESDMQNVDFVKEIDELEQRDGHRLTGELQNTTTQSGCLLLQQASLPQNGLESLPPITTFTAFGNDTLIAGGGNLNGSRDAVLHCPAPVPIINPTYQDQQFIPIEVYTPYPIPERICDKWISGNVRKRKKINVGPEYQAEIPPFKGNRKRKQALRNFDEKLWDPSILELCSFQEVDKYLEFACCSAVPGGGANKEYALHLLTLSKGNIKEAILRLMESLPALPAKLRSYSYLENQKWSWEEIVTFQISLIQVGKDFIRISKSVGTKSKAECICFYYFWKKVCSNECQIMKQIWKDRLEHQVLQPAQQQNGNEPFNSFNVQVSCNVKNYNMSFLVPAQEVRGNCK